MRTMTTPTKTSSMTTAAHAWKNFLPDRPAQNSSLLFYGMFRHPHLTVNNCRMDSISLPVVHPTFEKLKHSSRWLHATAALFILTHALSHVHRQEMPTIYFWCQLLISLDIFILVLAGRELLLLPRVN